MYLLKCASVTLSLSLSLSLTHTDRSMYISMRTFLAVLQSLSPSLSLSNRSMCTFLAVLQSLSLFHTHT